MLIGLFLRKNILRILTVLLQLYLITLLVIAHWGLWFQNILYNFKIALTLLIPWVQFQVVSISYIGIPPSLDRTFSPPREVIGGRIFKTADQSMYILVDN